MAQLRSCLILAAHVAFYSKKVGFYTHLSARKLISSCPLIQKYEVNSRGLEIFTKRWLPGTSQLKAVVCYCHGYGDTCTFFFEGMYFLQMGSNRLCLMTPLTHLNKLVNALFCRNCEEIGIRRIWCVCDGLPWIRPFRRSSLLYSKL